MLESKMKEKICPEFSKAEFGGGARKRNCLGSECAMWKEHEKWIMIKEGIHPRGRTLCCFRSTARRL